MAKIPTIVKRDSHGYVNKQRNLDGTADSIVSKRYISKKKPKKIIRARKTKPMTYVGIDLHKEFLQVETMDDKGHTLFNEKITIV